MDGWFTKEYTVMGGSLRFLVVAYPRILDAG